MQFIQSPSTDPYFNLALEQYVFDVLPREEEYFMLWQNDNAIIVGKHQNTAQEINATFVEEHDIKVVRRLSGGGAVYHDLGNLNFTYIVDANQGKSLDLGLFCKPVAQALNSMGVSAEVSGRNDITVDGKKFSGNAQYSRDGRTMHHGTILFDSNMGLVVQALNPSAEKLASKGVASVKSRVTNLKPYLGDVSLDEFKEQLVSAMFNGVEMEPYLLTAEDIRQVDELMEIRYATWDWNYGNSPSATLSKSMRIEGCGTLQVFIQLEKGLISTLEFRGDWFGAEDLSGLVQPLSGCALDRTALEQALTTVDLDHFITNLTAEDLIDLLTL